MTNAERRITIQYAKRVVGRKQMGGQNSYLPLKPVSYTHLDVYKRQVYCSRYERSAR